MARKVRVVTGSTSTAVDSPNRPIVVVSDNPRVSSNLSPREKQARRAYATTTTAGSMFRQAGDVIDSGQANFYSPQLSSDFLEKPQNIRERRAFYRFFYNTNEIVGSAIDIHSTLPLSKIRLVPPKGKNKHQNEYVFRFFSKMCEDVKLFKTLIEITHEYFLLGNAFIFSEEDDWFERLPPEEQTRKKEEARQRAQYLKDKYGIIDKNPLYKGWKKILILPPDQVRVRRMPLSDDSIIEFQPDPETRRFLTSDMPIDINDPTRQIKYDVPESIKEKVRLTGMVPMDTDPSSGSFVFHLARKKCQYESLGVSIIERCVNTLVYWDKLRQAQTSIASRHMTPMRIVWAEGLNDDGVDNLREQVDMALVDPDYSIIANYDIHWEEMGTQGRLLDATTESENVMNRLFAGLNVTRELLTGEGTYSGSRITLEVMNNMYLMYREIIQDYVENYIFKPIAIKKGFIDYDEYGNEIVLYPRLSFTRLAIRDNQQFFDAAFQLYQKGSISIDLILDILNIDPESTREKIEKDLFTVNDSLFNEVMRNIYTNVAAPLVEKTDLVQKMTEYLKLKMVEEAPPATEGESRFSSTMNPERRNKLAKLMQYFKEKPEILDKVFSKGLKNGSLT